MELVILKFHHDGALIRAGGVFVPLLRRPGIHLIMNRDHAKVLTNSYLGRFCQQFAARVRVDRCFGF